MTFVPSSRVDSFFFCAGLLASALLHAGLLFSHKRFCLSQELTVQPSDFSLEISLVEPVPSPPATKSEKVMLAAEMSPETTSSFQDSATPASPISPETPSRLTPPDGSTPPSITPASSTVLARPDGSRNQAPLYPEYARKKGWNGLVLLRVQISAQGQVETITLLQSSGYNLLDQAAMSAVGQWRFFPKKVGGQATPSVAEIPVKFSLKR